MSLCLVFQLKFFYFKEKADEELYDHLIIYLSASKLIRAEIVHVQE